MSSARGGGARGRGRISEQAAQRGARGAARGTPATRGTPSFRSNASRTGPAARGTPGRALRGHGARGGRDAPATGGTMSQTSQANTPSRPASKGSWGSRYEVLTQARERERTHAIREGLIADPDKPRSLADAITPVGTCQDMCAEYERVERVVQNDVWPEETDPNHSVYSSTGAPPDESRMVKKFRRAAAGLEEQLPSDLRPPTVLKRTCDYLFDEVIANAPLLEKVHHFVWDRTRAIRNDFSIQQLTKPDDLGLAVECYERIARFHILSLHQLAVLPRPYDKYDAQQEREQLDRTLLSLMQYYDDSRGRVDLPNEAEFRAYCVIFQLQDPAPDLEDRVQSWPRHVIHDRRVRKSLELYATACNTMDSQGPLKPRASHLIARQDWQRFWILVESPQVSYLMACVAEVYFNLVRRTALNALWRSFRSNPNKSPEDWTIEALAHLLGFDKEDQIYTFCKAYGFGFATREDGLEYLDLTSLRDRALPQPDVGLPKQWKSELVEDKRFGRTLPSIINGLTVKQAGRAGEVIEEAEQEGVEDEETEETKDFSQNAANIQETPRNPFAEDTSDHAEDEDSLFIPEAKPHAQLQNGVPSSQPLTNGFGGVSSERTNTASTAAGFSFGKPSGGTGGTFGKPSTNNQFFDAKPDAKSNDSKPLFLSSSTSTSTTSTPAAPAFTEPATLPSFKTPKFQGPGTFSFGSSSGAENKRVEEPRKPPFNFTSGNENGTSAKPTNKEEPPIPGFSWLPKPGQDEDKENRPKLGLFSDYQKSTVESAPASPEESLASDPSLPETGLAPSSSQVPKSEAGPSQPAFAPSVPGPALPGNAAPSPLNRKASLKQDNRPKAPSPLSNSFSFEDVSNPPAFSASTTKQSANDLLTSKLSSETSKPSEPAPTNTFSSLNHVRPETFDSIIARVAREVTLEEVTGFLDQYVEFAVQQAVESALEQVEREHAIEEADKHRESVLFRRYFKRWKDVFWGKRFAQHASRRRERARQGLEELRKSQSTASRGVFGRSEFGATSMNNGSGSSTHRDLLDSIFQNTLQSDVSQQNRAPDRRLHPGGKRSTSLRDAESSGTARPRGHKRLKSTNDVPEDDSIDRPASSTNTNTDILKRSSFLGFSIPSGERSGGSTTRSNYFRLKAMGIETLSQNRGTKRQRSESAEPGARALVPANKNHQRLKSNADLPIGDTVRSLSAPRSISGDDEALFARLRAARESLVESTSFMKAEVAKEDNLRRSPSNSQSSNESPSLARARAEVRSRASYAASSRATTEPHGAVPAYRLRESRFVPREHYSRAIERAKEIRESRSRETSRPESRAEQGDGSYLPQPHTMSHSVEPSFDAQQSAREFAPLGKETPNGMSGPPHSLWPSQANVSESNPSHHDIFPFDNGPHAVFDPQNHEAVWSSTNSEPFASFTSPPGLANSNSRAQQRDFTIPRSQVEELLSHSFGSPPGFSNQPSIQGWEHPDFVQPQDDDYIQTQPSAATDLTLDLGGPAQAPHAEQFAQHPVINEDHAEPNNDTPLDRDHPADEEEEEEKEEKMHDSYANGNPFAALASAAIDGDTEEDVDEDEGDDEEELESSIEYESGEEQRTPNGHRYYEEGSYSLEEDVNDEDSDIAEEDEGEDEEAYDEEAEGSGSVDPTSADEDEDSDPHTMGRWNEPPAIKNDTLQGVGGTAEEAIELSD